MDHLLDKPPTSLKETIRDLTQAQNTCHPAVPDDRLLTALLASPGLAESTKIEYLRLIKMFRDLWLENREEDFKIYDILITFGVGTFRSFADEWRLGGSLTRRVGCAFMALLVHTELKMMCPRHLRAWKEGIRTVTSTTKTYGSNVPSAREQEALKRQDGSYWTLDAIKDVYASLTDGSSIKVYLSFYVHTTPIRTADLYKTVLLGTGRSQGTNADAPESNAIDMSRRPYVLVLRDYKTKSHYGIKRKELPPEVCAQIDASLELRTSDYLFGDGTHTRASFKKWISNQLKRHFGDSFYCSLLRHLYVSDPGLCWERLTFGEMTKVADGMCNSVNTIQKCYRWMGQECWETRNENDKGDDERGCGERKGPEGGSFQAKAFLGRLRDAVSQVVSDSSRSLQPFDIILMIHLSNPLCVGPKAHFGKQLPCNALYECVVVGHPGDGLVWSNNDPCGLRRNVLRVLDDSAELVVGRHQHVDVDGPMRFLLDKATARVLWLVKPGLVLGSYASPSAYYRGFQRHLRRRGAGAGYTAGELVGDVGKFT